MHPYVTPELTRMIRLQQRHLRDAIALLDESPASPSGEISSGQRSPMEIFRSYQLLVDALLDAVESDRTPQG